MENMVKAMLWLESAKSALKNEKGQGMVEYGLILALVAVVVIGVLTTMGTNLTTMFTTAGSKLVP